jgi:hypothetical protein
MGPSKPLVKPAERDEEPERDPAGVLVAHRHTGTFPTATPPSKVETPLIPLAP